jgi:hypothetical protein
MSKKKTASKAHVIHDDNGVSFGANGIPFGTANGWAKSGQSTPPIARVSRWVKQA